jgi:hypothetical protein
MRQILCVKSTRIELDSMTESNSLVVWMHDGK